VLSSRCALVALRARWLRAGPGLGFPQAPKVGAVIAGAAQRAPSCGRQSRFQQHHATKNTTTTATAIGMANVSGVASNSMGHRFAPNGVAVNLGAHGRTACVRLAYAQPSPANAHHRPRQAAGRGGAPMAKPAAVTFALCRQPDANSGVEACAWSTRTSAAATIVQMSGSRGPDFRAFLSERMCEMSNLETYRDKARERAHAADQTHDSRERSSYSPLPAFTWRLPITLIASVNTARRPKTKIKP
jgi:hypothetical protein